MNRGSSATALRKELEYLNELNVTDAKAFYRENKAYIDGLNSRIDTYAVKSGMSEDAAVNALVGQSELSLREKLLGTVGTTALWGKPSTDSMSKYFSSYTYHYRGGYWTYSMTPKLTTRLLRSVCTSGWNQLVKTYPDIAKEEQSLSDQYWCHFTAFIESEWDIEEGRPAVGLTNTIRALCNP